VTNEQEAPLLEARETARLQYRGVAAEAGDWELPALIRQELEGWDFAAVVVDLGDASDVLGDRERIESRAGRLELEPSDALRIAFEGDGGLDGAAALAALELGALEAIAAATDRLAREPTPLEAIGLLGSDPAGFLSEARTSYEDGNATGAAAAANEATAVRLMSSETGSDRAVLAASAVLGLDGVVLVIVSAIRLRRRRPTRALISAA
jgi:hypothetical protein